ncbi:MAG: glycosyltransferase family 4 protein [Stigonema ocellatum SAG 48.90 = DSM 106950]|nr:glycosyltransferase family 4 protein [Stigonema ocellatum SAG 48.90 = DSM 106950]
MKVLHMTTYDSGGSGRAASRLNQGLQAIGVASQVLVQAKSTDDKTVIAPATKLGKGLAQIKPFLSRLPLSFYPQRDNTPYNICWLPDTVHSQVKQLNPDVINLHWIGDGYLDVKTIAKFNKPIVWTLHDMWAFTGGCHYSQNCNRYIDSCGACPQLHSQKHRDLSRSQWQRKVQAWKGSNLTLVSPSEWLAKCAQTSSVFQHVPLEVIPNGLDLSRYKPVNRQIAREFLNLPQAKQLILFGAERSTLDKRKGFHLLQLTLQNLSRLSSWRDRVELVVFGSSQPDNQIDLGFKSHYLGRLRDDISLSLIYAATDVFIAPSLEDNLPNTVMEAMACGIPCIAFNIGGMPEMIEHQKNGYLAQPYNVDDLVQGIIWILEDEQRHQELSYYARNKVEKEFTLETQARRYLSLFHKILKR